MHYRVLVVDDHPVVRAGVRALLDSQPGILVIGEAATGAEAIAKVKAEKPDLAILDLTMPDTDGLEAAQKMRAESPSTEILVLTMHFSDDLARELLRYGVMAYVLKSDAGADLLAAVDDVRHRAPFFTARLAQSMTDNYLKLAEKASGPLPGSPLTQREVDVVTLLADGKSNKQAATSMGVSSRTIESHRNHIMRKMNFASFSDLIRFAVRNNLVQP